MFASHHREQVVGMVLVDPVHPDMHHRAPFSPPASTPDRFHRLISTARYQAMLWSVPLGVPRILGWCRKTYTFANQPSEWNRLAPEAAAQYCRLRAWRAEEAQARDEDGSIPAKTGPFGDMPLVILSHDPQVGAFRRFFPPVKAAKAEHTWSEMQEELRDLSSRNKRIVAKGSERYVQIYRPELVLAAVHEIVNDARGPTRFEADPGTEYK
jgi:pimeloyl-ACP methyl ester carboxylesterase